MKNYYQVSAVSNSALKHFQVHPRYLRDFVSGAMPPMQGANLQLGTMIHSWLLEHESFEDDYMVLDIESPNSPNQKKFCELITGIDIKAQNKLIDAFKECYSTKSSSEAKIAENALKMAKLYQPYNEAIQSGKTPVSQLEIARLVEIEEKVRQHKLAEKLIYGKGVSEYEVYWDYKTREHVDGSIEKTVKCKSMLDRVIIGEPEIPTATDRPNTYNITIVDLKTTQLDLMTFIDNNLVGLSYVRQLAFYGMSILEGGWKGLLESNQINHGNKPKLQLVYYIVTISLNRGVDVEVFSIPLNLIQAETEIIKRLLDDIAWHELTNNWDHPREYYEGDGSLKI